jgi:hypothetical protein
MGRIFFINFKKIINLLHMKIDKIIITTPAGKKVEMLSEQEYFNLITENSRISLPMPHDYNN